jgi:hypothetical protein
VSRQLLSGIVEERNKLSVSIDSDDTTVVCSYPVNSLQPGTIFEISSELFYVWATNTSTNTLTVERGYSGTTAVSHSSGAVLTLNPRFPKAQMFDALNQDIDDLSSPANGLFRVVTADLSYNGSDRQINITGATNIIDLVDVRLRYLSDDFPVIRRVRLGRDLPTADFASGYSLIFDGGDVEGALQGTVYSFVFCFGQHSVGVVCSCFDGRHFGVWGDVPHVVGS